MSYYDDVNKVILTGRVGKEPTVSGEGKKPFAAFTLATNKSYKQGEAQVNQATWHDVVCFGRLAESVKQHVKKGDRLYIEGEISYNTWTNKAGVEQSSTNIVIRELRFLDSKKMVDAAVPTLETQSSLTE